MNKAFESQKESVALQESEGRISGNFCIFIHLESR